MKVLQKTAVAGIISLLFFSTSAYADASAASGAYAAADTGDKFTVGVEGGFTSSSVDHSYRRRGGTGDGIECGSLQGVKDGIGSTLVGLYGQYSGGSGWGARLGFSGAGDSTVRDLLAMYTDESNENGFKFFGGLGISSLEIDIKTSVRLSGLCNSLVGTTLVPVVLPAQKYTFQGVKVLLGVEKHITEQLSWTITGNFVSYSGREIDTRDGFETIIEPRINSLNVGLVYYF